MGGKDWLRGRTHERENAPPNPRQNERIDAPGTTNRPAHQGLRTRTSRRGCPESSPSRLLPCSAAAAALPRLAQSRIEGCRAPLTPWGSSLTCAPPHTHTDPTTEPDIQTGIHSDTQAGRQTDRQAGRKVCKQAGRQADGKQR